MSGKSIHGIFNSNSREQVKITDELVQKYNLERWAKNFNLMTAGYRDQLDPNDFASSQVAFNALTVAILGEAKARVFKGFAKPSETIHVHVGGETRPHTQKFIEILARVYAAHQFVVHLRSNIKTTPIWYSSFGVFYMDYQSGDNLTASHSQFFKGGWKPIDQYGKQLVEEEESIIKEVRSIVKNRSSIQLSPWGSSPLILSNFDVTNAYVDYQKSVVSSAEIEKIKNAGKKGFRCSVCTVGGSMKKTTEQIFKSLNLSTGEDGLIQYFYDEENSQYHQIGQVDGDNYGVDPTKRQIYKNIGAQDRLLNNSADIVFIWDPDGDRFNMVTTAPANKEDYYKAQGLEIESYPKSDRCVVYFTPNQIFFMLTAYRIENLSKSGKLDQFDWFMASSVTTSRSLDELAKKYNIPLAHVKVGFKYWGNFAKWIETRKEDDISVPLNKMALNENVKIGRNPRLIIMCEESGGAVLGGALPVTNHDKTRNMVGMREKDGFQLGFLSLSLAANLFEKSESFADYYAGLFQKYSIRHKFFHRHDERLYDETLSGKDRESAIANAETKKQQVIDFFKGLAKDFQNGATAEEIQKMLNKCVADTKNNFPIPERLCLIGESVLEGTYLEFDSFWIVVRASGTDAVLRYYIEAENMETIDQYQKAIVNMKLS